MINFYTRCKNWVHNDFHHLNKLRCVQRTCSFSEWLIFIQDAKTGYIMTFIIWTNYAVYKGPVHFLNNFYTTYKNWVHNDFHHLNQLRCVQRTCSFSERLTFIQHTKNDYIMTFNLLVTYALWLIRLVSLLASTLWCWLLLALSGSRYISSEINYDKVVCILKRHFVVKTLKQIFCMQWVYAFAGALQSTHLFPCDLLEKQDSK